jgi:hypothetical protein
VQWNSLTISAGGCESKKSSKLCAPSFELFANPKAWDFTGKIYRISSTDLIKRIIFYRNKSSRNHRQTAAREPKVRVSHRNGHTPIPQKLRQDAPNMSKTDTSTQQHTQ